MHASEVDELIKSVVHPPDNLNMKMNTEQNGHIYDLFIYLFFFKWKVI